MTAKKELNGITVLHEDALQRTTGGVNFSFGDGSVRVTGGDNTSSGGGPDLVSLNLQRGRD